MSRILYVEDEADLREALVEVLEEEGYTVASACHGKQGLEILPRFAPDLVITGWLMPVMTGIQMIREMRKISSPFVATPVILVSAYTAKAHMEEAIRIGACRFVTKPVDYAALLTVIAGYCNPHARAPRADCACLGLPALASPGE